jgi:hypothetical protein
VDDQPWNGYPVDHEQPHDGGAERRGALGELVQPMLRSISFSGYIWEVKSAPKTKVGPGPNFFSDSGEDIFADRCGLHLRTAERDERWFATEAKLAETPGFGIYTFQLSSNVLDLDERAVFSGFLYEDDSHEIDIEFSKALAGSAGGQYVVQPWQESGHLTRFHAPCAKETSHRITWGPGAVSFHSWQGHTPEPDDASLVAAWEYKGISIPSPHKARMIFNIWLYQGQTPGKADEVIVAALVFDKM